MESIKVSIIVSAYNIENYIRRCIESLINQDFNSYEIIIVNDGSTDNTGKVLKEFLSNKKVKIINRKNEGVMKARKIGLELAKGEFILFVDGDDWIEKSTIKKLYNSAIKNNSDIVLYNAYLSWDNTKKCFRTYDLEENEKEDYLRSLLLGEIIPTLWSKFIKKAYLINNKIEFPSKLIYGEDLATMVNIFKYKPKISKISDFLYYYYQRESSITKLNDERILQVNQALDYVNEVFLKENLLEEYKKEYEYMVYSQLFITKFLKTNRESDLSKKIYKQYKSKNIKIFNNKYIIEAIKKGTLNYKMRIILYDLSYYIGNFYDFIRERIDISKIVRVSS